MKQNHILNCFNSNTVPRVSEQSITSENDVYLSPDSRVLLTDSAMPTQFQDIETVNNPNAIEVCSSSNFALETEFKHTIVEESDTNQKTVGTNIEKYYQHCVYVRKKDGFIISGSNFRTCGVCGFRSLNKKSLTTHMRLAHNMMKMFRCPYDHYSTPRMQHFQEHMNSQHFNIRYQCNKCDFSSNSSQCFRRHYALHHNNIKTFTCNFCDYWCDEKAQVDIHNRNYHSYDEINFLNCE